MSTPRRIAVLGAGGFIGSHLVPALLELPDTEIDAVDLDLGKLELESPRVRRHLHRVGTASEVDELVTRAECVISLTALCNPSLYNQDPLAVIDASYTDLVPLVKRCAEQGKRLIHLSTCEVYGKLALDGQGRATPAMSEDETSLFLGPVASERWSYASAKQLLERVIWAHGKHRGLDFTIVRPFNVIGARMDFVPGVDGEGVPRVLASFMAALLRGEQLQLVDGGYRRRSFVDAGEFVQGLVRIVQRPRACSRQIVNLGNPDNELSVRELAELLARAFAGRVPGGVPARFRDVTAEAFYGPGYEDSERRVPDIARARALLDWQPQRTLAAMLPEIVDDYVRRYRDVLVSTAPRAEAASE